MRLRKKLLYDPMGKKTGYEEYPEDADVGYMYFYDIDCSILVEEWTPVGKYTNEDEY